VLQTRFARVPRCGTAGLERVAARAKREGVGAASRVRPKSRCVGRGAATPQRVREVKRGGKRLGDYDEQRKDKRKKREQRSGGSGMSPRQGRRGRYIEGGRQRQGDEEKPNVRTDVLKIALYPGVVAR